MALIARYNTSTHPDLQFNHCKPLQDDYLESQDQIRRCLSDMTCVFEWTRAFDAEP